MLSGKCHDTSRSKSQGYSISCCKPKALKRRLFPLSLLCSSSSRLLCWRASLQVEYGLFVEHVGGRTKGCEAASGWPKMLAIHYCRFSPSAFFPSRLPIPHCHVLPVPIRGWTGTCCTSINFSISRNMPRYKQAPTWHDNLLQFGQDSMLITWNQFSQDARQVLLDSSSDILTAKSMTLGHVTNTAPPVLLLLFPLLIPLLGSS